jgi:hypothetical protein
MSMIQVQLDAEDYVSASILHTRWTRKWIVLSLLCIVAGLLLVLVHQEWSRLAGYMLVGSAVGGSIGHEAMRRFQLPRKARRLFSQQKNLQRPIGFTWDQHGLDWTSENGAGRIPWDDFIKWRQNERVVLLYHSDLLFQMLPKRAFTEEGQLQSIMENLNGRGAS